MCRAKERKIVRIIVKFENARHDDPLTCFQEENASVAERNSMKRIPGRSSRDFLATRKERSKGKRGKKKRREKEGERESEREIKLEKSKGKRDSRHYWKRAERQREEKGRGEGRGKEREKRARSCESGTGATTKSQCWVTCIQEVNSFVAVS